MAQSPATAADKEKPAGGDGFLVHNGPGRRDFILTSGMWWLLVGDRPRLSMELRTSSGAYAEPGLLPGLEIAGNCVSS